MGFIKYSGSCLLFSCSALGKGKREENEEMNDL